MATDLYAGPGDPGDVVDFGVIEQAVRLGLAGKRSLHGRSESGKHVANFRPRDSGGRGTTGARIASEPWWRGRMTRRLLASQGDQRWRRYLLESLAFASPP